MPILLPNVLLPRLYASLNPRCGRQPYLSPPPPPPNKKKINKQPNIHCCLSAICFPNLSWVQSSQWLTPHQKKPRNISAIQVKVSPGTASKNASPTGMRVPIQVKGETQGNRPEILAWLLHGIWCWKSKTKKKRQDSQLAQNKMMREERT